MNVFRSKKKQALKETVEDVGRPSQDSEAAPQLKSKKTFRMNKKKDVEPPKFELDLVNALPASDDFRTSLLMTGLSARFSMLREQDDPNSKLGKASDDSVLFPRRQSRMNNFDFTPKGLTNIAEDASIKDSFRRPFASIDTERVGSSYSQDGYGTDIEGSIMSRAKPAEGNILFGGRQKVYKIPNHAVSATKLEGASIGLGGRAVYDDDLGLSAFQKLKLREKEEKEEKDRLDAANNESAQETSTSRPESPTLAGYNRNRETSSTTSSGPSGARSSTAATSFMSQRTPSVNGHSAPSTPAVPLQASATGSFIKNRRVHENANDPHTVAALSVAGNQGRGTAVRSPSPDVSRLQGAQAQLAAMRPAARSPQAPQAPSGGFDFGVSSVTPEPRRTPGIARPLSPPQSEGEDTMLPIQSNSRPSLDTPASVKPKGSYDEGKYQERQMQMQQGREIPPLRKNSPPRAFSPRIPDAEAFSRSRADSQATSSQGYNSARSRSQSSTQREFVPRERIAAPPRRDVVSPDGPPAAPRFFPPRNDAVPTPALTPIAEPARPEISAWEQASAYDEFQADIPPSLRTTKLPPPQHPALRRDRLSDHDEQKSNLTAQTSSGKSSRLPSPIEVGRPKNSQPADSPTLPPPGGLSGLVRQHLRSDSDASSVNADDINDFSPTASSMFSEPAAPRMPPAGSQGLPGLTRASANQQDLRAISQVSDTPSWEKELHRHHSREMSTDTQRERDDFASELAARRRKVQENLRNFAESESRSQSPVRAPTMKDSNEAAFAKNNRLNFLKSKTSRGSLVNPDQQQPAQTKAMGVLGMSNASAAALDSRFDDSPWKREEEEMMRGVPKAAKTPPAQDFRRERRDAQRERERQMMSRQPPVNGPDMRSPEERERERHMMPRQQVPRAPDMRSSEERSRRQMEQPMPFRQADYGRQRHPASRARSPSRDAPPISFRGQPVPRNGSQPGSANNSRPGTAERSSSEGRNGGHRDDRGRPSYDQHNGGRGDHQQAPMRQAPGLPPIGAMPAPPHSGPPSRARAESRTQQFPGYYDNHPSQAGSASPNYDGMSQRQAPVAPFAANTTPALAHQSPVGSARSTPVTPHGFQTQHFENQRVPGGRKKSVNKSEISEPQFVSTTSRISTIQLPNNEPGVGVGGYKPPLPPMDPRRRQPSNPKGMFSAWGRRDDANNSSPDLPMHMQNHIAEEQRMGMGSAEGEYKQRREPRKLRKISSEGGNLNGRGMVARGAGSPAVPQGFAAGGAPGGMF